MIQVFSKEFLPKKHKNLMKVKIYFPDILDGQITARKIILSNSKNELFQQKNQLKN